MEDIIQGTPEWHALRLGKVTASRVADVIAKTKTGPSASRAKYAGELIAERLTGTPADR
ncbi:MAG: exonuclease, partial [Proteobacteria bacterium]|nr:exonuclease [Pseudomonadota bacterium]